MEEDLKILEELLNANVSFKISPEDRGYKAIENLIKGYRELEEKIKRYEKELDLDYVDNNFISISKIKENIKKYAEQFVETEKIEDELNFYILEDK